MTRLLIRPSESPRLEIRCNVGDAIVANLAVHIVFFFERRLDTTALADAFARALTTLPVFAARTAVAGGRMVIRSAGQGVPFTSVSSERTLREAIRSAADDDGGWLVDPVNGPAARWGLGPLCRVRVTSFADDATAIGLSWHHVVGDMQTAMHLMNAWSAAAAGEPLAEPLIVEDRAAYLDEHLPADGAREPGVRCLRIGEFARSALYLAKDARKQRTLGLHFGDDEIARMRAAYGDRTGPDPSAPAHRLSANDVVCAHVAEALMEADPAVDRRTLAIAVNARNRCGLDPMLVGNIITTLNLELRRGESAGSIAERLRRMVDHFSDEHCDMRANQRFLDGESPWRAARCVSTSFDPARCNLLVSNWSGFGVYRTRFEDTVPSYYTPVLKLPVAGLAALTDGPGERGLTFQISLPPREFQAMASPATQRRLRRFRTDSDVTPSHRETIG